MSLNNALKLAKRGYRVLPVSATSKNPAIGGVGCYQATTDEDQIRTWWGERPNARVGVAAGEGLVVIDLDVKDGKDGIAAFTRWAQEHDVSWRPTVTTPSGGQHVYFRTQSNFSNTVGKLLDGVDVRSMGGYVVAYGRVPRLEDLPELDPQLAQLLGPKDVEQPVSSPREPDEADAGPLHPYAAAAIEKELARLQAEEIAGWAGEGWNSTTYEVACNLLELANSEWSGYTLEQAEADLLEHAPTDPGFGPKEHRNCWESARKKVGGKYRPDPRGGAEADFQPFEDGSTGDHDDAFNNQVEVELRRLQIREEARRRLRVLEAPPAEPFDAGTLAEILARPPEPEMRINGLQPWESSVLLTAQRKTGKTTMSGNYASSLLTGEPFLGFDVRKLDGDLAFLNFEVSGAQLARWLHEIGVPTDRCHIVNLRGRRNPLANPDDWERLAQHLRARGVEAVIVDPFGRAFSGDNQNDNSQVGRWLVDLDRFVRGEVGATDLLLTAHAGWAGERTRGASALEDWADVIWTMTRDADDGQGVEFRYFKAEGRDVLLEEDRLDFDEISRTLSLTGDGNRRHAAQSRKVEATRTLILATLASHPEGLSGADLGDKTGIKDKSLTQARDQLVDDCLITKEKRSGKGGGYIYRAAETP